MKQKYKQDFIAATIFYWSVLN